MFWYHSGPTMDTVVTYCTKAIFISSSFFVGKIDKVVTQFVTRQLYPFPSHHHSLWQRSTRPEKPTYEYSKISPILGTMLSSSSIRSTIMAFTNISNFHNYLYSGEGILAFTSRPILTVTKSSHSDRLCWNTDDQFKPKNGKKSFEKTWNEELWSFMVL